MGKDFLAIKLIPKGKRYLQKTAYGRVPCYDKKTTTRTVKLNCTATSREVERNTDCETTRIRTSAEHMNCSYRKHHNFLDEWFSTERSMKYEALVYLQFVQRRRAKMLKKATHSKAFKSISNSCHYCSHREVEKL